MLLLSSKLALTCVALELKVRNMMADKLLGMTGVPVMAPIAVFHINSNYG